MVDKILKNGWSIGETFTRYLNSPIISQYKKNNFIINVFSYANDEIFIYTDNYQKIDLFKKDSESNVKIYKDVIVRGNELYDFNTGKLVPKDVI